MYREESMQHRESEQTGEQSASDYAKPRTKKNYRHTPRQTQKLEAVFQECPNPDEKKRHQLSKELGLAPHQIKFWFQNRRTQAKVKSERLDNRDLKVENEKIRAENETLKEALKNSICLSCGVRALLIEQDYEEQKLQIENAQLKQQLGHILGGLFARVKPMNLSIGSHAMSSNNSSTVPHLDQIQHLNSDSGSYRFDPDLAQLDIKPPLASGMPNWWNCSSSSFK